MTIDMSKYLSLFVSESTEHLEAFGRDLVAFEKSPETATIDSMFRHAHSVKGMAASMGFEATATLAHRVEDLVDALRSDFSQLNREVVDLLLASVDTLLSHVAQASESKPIDETQSRQLQQKLSEKVSSLTGKSPTPTRVAKTVVHVLDDETPAAGTPRHSPSGGGGPSGGGAPVALGGVDGNAALEAPPSAAGRSEGLGLPPRFSVKLRIAPTCAVPGVRGFLVHKKLVDLGQIFDLKPALEDVKAGRIPDGLISLELETQAGEAGIAQALKNISEVELVSLKPVAHGTPAAPPPSAPTDVGGPKVVGQEQARTVRVRIELLDFFLDAVGELLLATGRIREVGRVLPELTRQPLEEAVDRLHGLVKDLHDKVMKARMTPLAVITDRLPRAARDIARKRDRDVDLVISGAEVELDRAIIDDLSDPLLHILRNCIDHGIESPQEREEAKKAPKGRVLVSVKRARDRVIIEIEDDGRGMDAARLKAAAVARGLITHETALRLSDKEAFMLSCLPGVSTARDISEISGRGVGMDAVKRTVESVGGTLEIESEKGRGTRFTLRLPLTVAVVTLLLVEVGQEVYGLPVTKVVGAGEADLAQLSKSREALMVSHAGQLLPVHVLSELLEVPAPPRIGVRPYVVVDADSGKVALAVDRLLAQEEVVLKALSKPLDLVAGLSGVTILGTGRPVFILDVPRLLQG